MSDDLHPRAAAAVFAIEYEPLTGLWGMRRFYVRDPLGRLVNILVHTE